MDEAGGQQAVILCRVVVHGTGVEDQLVVYRIIIERCKRNKDSDCNKYYGIAHL